jgi:hypothetical protein
MTSVIAAAVTWLTAPARLSDSYRPNCRRQRRRAAALFLAAGGGACNAGALCQALFTERANGWMAKDDAHDGLAVRFLRSWPRGKDLSDGSAPADTEGAGSNGRGLCVLHLPLGAPLDEILCAAAAFHPGTVREVVTTEQPPTHLVLLTTVAASTFDRCVAAWAPNLVVWSVFGPREASMCRSTVDALYRGGCPNLEVLALPINSSAAAAQHRDSREGLERQYPGDVLHDPADAIVPLPRLARVIVYKTSGWESVAELPSYNLARLAPSLRELVFGDSVVHSQNFPPAVSSGMFPALSVLRNNLPSQLRRAVEEAADDADARSALLQLPDVVEIPDIDAREVAAWAVCTPNLRRLTLAFYVSIPAATLLDALRPLQALRHLVLNSVDGVDYFDDTLISGLLTSLPRLVELNIGAQNHFATSVAFDPAAFDSRLTCSSLRELNIARQCGIRKLGLRTIVRLFPNLRALDVRGCFGLSLNAFAAAMLEVTRGGAVAGAATDGPSTRRVSRRLRLRKLRRVIASYRRRVPKALNFIEYHCGNYGEFEKRFAVLEPDSS